MNNQRVDLTHCNKITEFTACLKICKEIETALVSDTLYESLSAGNYILHDRAFGIRIISMRDMTEYVAKKPFWGGPYDN